MNTPGTPSSNGDPSLHLSRDSAVTTENPGLTTQQAEKLRAEGKGNTIPPATGKSVVDIVRSNVFTRINGILGVLFIAVLSTGSWINSAFGFLIIINSAIGIIQELRAKHTLDSLSIVGSEHPLVRRDGSTEPLDQADIVLGDVIELRSGSQIVVDGEVCESDYLIVNESMLTGESDAVPKARGDAVLSGSYVLAGVGAYRVTAVGSDSYAAQIAAQASHYTLKKSRLQQAIDKILRYVTWVLIPVAIATVFLQWNEPESTWRSTVLAITGALVPMIPEGLVLITSTAFALGVIRLGKHNVLVQELPAIEGLARIDVLCADKTGTLTENALDFNGFIVADGGNSNELRHNITALYAFAYADPDPNPTLQAIRSSDVITIHSTQKNQGSEQSTDAQRYSIDIVEESDAASLEGKQTLPTSHIIMRPADWRAIARQPFNSAYKWSAVQFAHQGTWVLGAPEIISAATGTEHDRETRQLIEHAEVCEKHGLRTLMFARATNTLLPETDDASEGIAQAQPLPVLAALQPIAVVVYGQKIRESVKDTIAYFNNQGVTIKIISGDSAQAVAAITEQVGIKVQHSIDVREMSKSELREQVLTADVFGRVRPEQKQAMVQALQDAGHTVAMTGDGVNDVLALKDADLGIAMGSGSAAARAVSKIVLLDNSFATLPHVVAEGRRVIGNIERVANLFLTKTMYSATLAVLVIFASVPFPFQPIHVTITGWFTIGIPAFILSLPKNNSRARDGFVRRVVIFSLPAGIIVGAASFFTYLWTSGFSVPEYHVQQSTAALLALIIPSVWVLAVIARPWNAWKLALFLLPLTGYWLIFLLPFTQNLFLLDSSNKAMMLQGTIVGLAAAGLIECLWWIVRKETHGNARLWNSQRFPIFTVK